MKEIKTIAEYEELIGSNDKVVLKIGTESCGPCKVTQSNLEHLENKYDDIKFAFIDADECDEDLIDRFNIRGVPVVLIIVDGDEKIRNSGLLTLENAEQLIINS